MRFGAELGRAHDIFARADPVVFFRKAELVAKHLGDIFPDCGRGGEPRRLDAGAVYEIRRIFGFADDEVMPVFMGAQAGK